MEIKSILICEELRYRYFLRNYNKVKFTKHEFAVKCFQLWHLV